MTDLHLRVKRFRANKLRACIYIIIMLLLGMLKENKRKYGITLSISVQGSGSTFESKVSQKTQWRTKKEEGFNFYQEASSPCYPFLSRPSK